MHGSLFWKLDAPRTLRFPVNIFPTDAITDPALEGSWLYEGVGNLIEEYLTPEALARFKTDGSYVMRPYQGLKIINLNNNYGTK